MGISCREAAMGMLYFGARYYDPFIGRWLGRDPEHGHVRLPSTLNRYNYVLNNPLKLIDKDGEWPTDAASYFAGKVESLVPPWLAGAMKDSQRKAEIRRIQNRINKYEEELNKLDGLLDKFDKETSSLLFNVYKRKFDLNFTIEMLESLYPAPIGPKSAFEVGQALGGLPERLRRIQSGEFDDSEIKDPRYHLHQELKNIRAQERVELEKSIEAQKEHINRQIEDEKTQLNELQSND